MAIRPKAPLPRANAWYKRLAVLALVAGCVEIPINHVFGYALLVVAALLIFTGAITVNRRAWLAALCVVAMVIAGKWWIAPQEIEEGHNVFLGEHAEALKAGLPDDVFRFMARQFDQQYPPDKRCAPDTQWCWRGTGLPHYLDSLALYGNFPTYRTCLPTASTCPVGFPVRTFAFSADGLFQSPLYSRRVTAIDFAEPAWLRLGFLNDGAYNWWNLASDVKRAVLDPHWSHGIHRWRITMPWFVMYQFPRAYIGSDLCWRGDVLWQTDDGRFEALHHDNMACRTIRTDDAGKRIFGIAIKPDTLAMRLDPVWPIWMANWTRLALMLAGAAGVLALLVRPDFTRAALPALLIAFTLVLVAMVDVTTIGGLRAQEGGNDGLFYEAAGRVILQDLAAGDISSALEGSERVFYYGGPGMRYLRALEKIVFGETNLGYLSLLLIFPLVVWWLFHRFLSPLWARIAALLFIATPVGAFFGSTFFFYVKYALQGFGDTASYLFYLAGLVVIVGPLRAGADRRFAAAFGGGLLIALSLFVRPVVAPAVAVLLGGAGLAALYQRQWQRLAGLCAGFLPVIVMPLHNWYFGGVLVPFSANAKSEVLKMTPFDYAQVIHDLLHLNFATAPVLAAYRQAIDFPVEFIGQTGGIVYYLAIPVHVAAVAIVAAVAASRRFDPWLRLIAGAALAQHCVAFFYSGAIRYFFLAWFLTMLVSTAWCEQVGAGWLKRWLSRHSA